MTDTDRADVTIIGAGIVGLASAYALREARPEASIIVVDKEARIASHQTGRNSGVIHAGLYYTPGSLKARLCVEGARRMFEFCGINGIATTRTGKIVVATDPAQIAALDELARRALENGVLVERLGPDEIRVREPRATGIDGLWVPSTGSVDFSEVASAMARRLESGGVAILTGFEVTRADVRRGEVVIGGPSGDVVSRVVLNCSGLHVDRLARLLGTEPGLSILPFRGEYYSLTEAGADLVRGHVYPVPDPRFPHLGVHFTRSVAGKVEVGPNAVWAWGRQAYRRLAGSPRDAFETLRYRGFWNLARRHWRTGAAEQWRSLNKAAFVANARRLIPELTVAHLAGWRSGIRAQAVLPDGSLADDFVIDESPGVISVLNAPSPAATACLTIGEHIADRVVAQLAGR